MNADYNPVNFWNAYCRKYGQTGWSDNILYRYDQPLRMRAIKTTMSKLNIPSKGIALDIGCGIGDITSLLEKLGFRVIGIDISQEVCQIASKRFKDNSHVQINCMRIEEMNFKKAQFDLVTSVTVLQHIVSNEELLETVKKIVEVVKPGGYIILMESIANKSEEKATYASDEIFTVPRSVDIWRKLMENEGCKLESVSGYPGWGAEVSQTLAMYASPLIGQSGTSLSGSSDTNRVRRAQDLFRVVRVGVLTFCFTLDYLLRITVPNKLSHTKIMVFKKTKGHD